MQSDRTFPQKGEENEEEEEEEERMKKETWLNC